VVHAIDSFVVRDIRVEGLQRIAPGTVFNYLPVRVGDTLTESAGARQSRRCSRPVLPGRAPGTQRQTLVVHVAERPSIDSIIISGTKDIDDKTLKQGLKTSAWPRPGVQQLAARQDRAGAQAPVLQPRPLRVSVKTTVTPLERNR